MKTLLTSLFFIIFFVSCTQQEDIKLEKIIYNTDDYGCWGLCPIYQLELTNDLTARLHVKKFLYYDSICYKTDFEYCETKTDSSKVGYFKGKISQKQFNEIKQFIERNRIDTVQNSSAKMDCNDALYEKFILYFTQNQRKEIHYRCAENMQIDSLSLLLHNFIEINKLERTNESFYLENIESKI